MLVLTKRKLMKRKQTIRSSRHTFDKIRVADSLQALGCWLLGYFFGNERSFENLPAGWINRLKRWLNPIY